LTDSIEVDSFLTEPAKAKNERWRWGMSEGWVEHTYTHTHTQTHTNFYTLTHKHRHTHTHTPQRKKGATRLCVPLPLILSKNALVSTFPVLQMCTKNLVGALPAFFLCILGEILCSGFSRPTHCTPAHKAEM
jgi:hypothetical protein